MRTDKIKSIIIIDKQHETNGNIFLLRDKTESRLAMQEYKALKKKRKDCGGIKLR
jgi:hypothetical protein